MLKLLSATVLTAMFFALSASADPYFDSVGRRGQIVAFKCGNLPYIDAQERNLSQLLSSETCCQCPEVHRFVEARGARMPCPLPSEGQKVKAERRKSGEGGSLVPPGLPFAVTAATPIRVLFVIDGSSSMRTYRGLTRELLKKFQARMETFKDVVIEKKFLIGDNYESGLALMIEWLGGLPSTSLQYIFLVGDGWDDDERPGYRGESPPREELDAYVRRFSDTLVRHFSNPHQFITYLRTADVPYSVRQARAGIGGKSPIYTSGGTYPEIEIVTDVFQTAALENISGIHWVDIAAFLSRYPHSKPVDASEFVLNLLERRIHLRGP